MILKTGRRCVWDEIKVGEVFAWEGCWAVSVKIDESNAMLLSTDFDDTFSCELPNIFNAGGISGSDPIYNGRFTDWEMSEVFKLPLRVQRLWKEE